METLFFYPAPPRILWDSFCAAVCQDEEQDLETAENTFDDLILFEVDEKGVHKV